MRLRYGAWGSLAVWVLSNIVEAIKVAGSVFRRANLGRRGDRLA